MSSIAERIINLTRENSQLAGKLVAIESRIALLESVHQSLQVTLRGREDIVAAVAELMSYARSTATAAATLAAILKDMQAHGGQTEAFANSILTLVQSNQIPAWATAQAK